MKKLAASLLSGSVISFTISYCIYLVVQFTHSNAVLMALQAMALFFFVQSIVCIWILLKKDKTTTTEKE